MDRTVLFRTDGNPSIGSGHVMRCLSIADVALHGSYRSYRPIFITAGEEFSSFIKHRGYEDIVLHTEYQDMESEVEELESLIAEHKPSAIFIDSYYVTVKYLSILCATSRAAGTKVIYIDDVLAFGYPCDYLLNYNIYGPNKIDTYHKLYHSGDVKEPHFLLGTSYAPLRSEFQNLKPRVVKERCTDILISTGGADFEHMTISLIQAVISLDQEKKGRTDKSPLSFHFVIGAMNEDREEIHRLAGNNPHIVLHSNVSQMSTLMRKMDLTISAAGSTLYELCATQTPTITYILADNQIPGAEGFQDHHVLTCAGDVRESSPAELSKKLIDMAVRLAGDYKQRVETAARMKEVVDGKGAERIIKEVFGGKD